ncbi:hypothetical protein GCM10023096_82170 [Nonomuraea ferruginea]
MATILVELNSIRKRHFVSPVVGGGRDGRSPPDEASTAAKLKETAMVEDTMLSGGNWLLRAVTPRNSWTSDSVQKPICAQLRRHST